MSFNISRFRDIESQEYEVEIVTPMFLGGGNPNQAELRSASVKGALRFWWRAIYGSNNIKEMKKRESELFGSTEQKAKLNISISNSFNIEPIKKNLTPGKKYDVPGKTFKPGIIDYLAFGIRDHKDGYKKQHFESGVKFLLNLKYPKQFENQIMDALQCWIKYGGLGAKTRNGFGSLNCETITENTIEIKNFATTFTGFNTLTRLFKSTKKSATWSDALSEIGLLYKDARLSLENKHQYNKRSLISKPIIQSKDLNFKNKRHTKPYFLHVNKLEDNQYQGQILYMPYEYYDEGQRENYKRACDKMNAYLVQELEVQDDF